MIETFGLSDVGCVRELNEDSFCIHGFDEEHDRGFYILADGMGGHNAGEVASQNAVKTVAEELSLKIGNILENEIPKALIDAVAKANDRIYGMSLQNSYHRGMGTTLVIAVTCGGTAYVANVGDSRAYAHRAGELVQITADHSVVAELVMNGTITKDEARVHPQKNIITRAVGTDEKVRADIFEYDYEAGDTLLICSDGLCTMLTDDEICGIINGGETSENTVCKLVDAAKEKGGLDNVTVICIRFI